MVKKKTKAKRAKSPAGKSKPVRSTKKAKKAKKGGVPAKRRRVATAAPAKKRAKKSAARKVAAKRVAKPVAKPAKPAAKKPMARVVRRRDGVGHLEPQYAADLRARSGRPDREPSSFLDRPRSSDDLVEELGEEVVAEATSAEHGGEDILDQEVPEERGGPFVETTGAEEFAHGIDASNPRGAKREPFPTT